jgi:hypothetical protein
MSGTVVAKNVRINKKKNRSVSGIIGKIIGMINSHYKNKTARRLRIFERLAGTVTNIIPQKVDCMTEYCLSCLGCQQMEREDFNGLYRCPMWVDGREPEPEQMEMEER